MDWDDVWTADEADPREEGRDHHGLVARPRAPQPVGPRGAIGASITIDPTDMTVRQLFAGRVGSASYFWTRIMSELVAPGPTGSVIIEFEHGHGQAWIRQQAVMGPLTGPAPAGAQYVSWAYPGTNIAVRVRWQNASSVAARVTIVGGGITP